MSFRLLVTGSREWDDEVFLYGILSAYYSTHGPDVTLVVGDCPTGADEQATRFAEACRWELEIYRADWGKYGRAAGPIRNQEMVVSGAGEAVAFYKMGAGNRGTVGCARLAKDAGIPVQEVWA